MERIKEYIMNGKGCGFKFVAILSLFMALLFANEVKNVGETLIPHFQAATDALFPIKIEDGVVVEPAEAVKSYNVNLDGEGTMLNIVVDTTIDSLNTADLPMGVYMTRKNIYVAAPDKVTTYPLSGNAYFQSEDYRPTMLNAVVWMAIFGSVVMFFIYLLAYSLYVWLFSWTARLVAITFNRVVPREVEKRISMTCVVAGVLVALGLEYAGIYGFWPFAALVVLLELWLFWLLKESYKMPLRRQKAVERI